LSAATPTRKAKPAGIDFTAGQAACAGVRQRVPRSQRFRALSSGCPVYLAIHTIHDAIPSPVKRIAIKAAATLRWQAHIRDWRRNLYRYSGVFPAVAEEDVLLLSPEPLDVVESELGYQPTKTSGRRAG
jgi:hypothetical protein